MSKGSGESIKHPTGKTVTLTAQKRANYLLMKTYGKGSRPTTHAAQNSWVPLFLSPTTIWVYYNPKNLEITTLANR